MTAYVVFVQIVILNMIIFVVGAMEEHVIIVIHRDPPAESPAMTPKPVSPGEDRGAGDAWLYEHIYKDPSQFFIDSPRGPMPLWGMDMVYLEDGRPFPKYPHPIVKRLIENPDDRDAYADYLAWRQVSLRRARLTGERLPEMAIDLGILDERTFRIPDKDDPRSMSLGATTKVEPESLGRSAFSPEQKDRLGMADSNLRTPGEANPIEVFWFWSPRCSYTDQMARDWFYFANDVQAAGYKAVSVTNERDNPDGYSKLQLWAVRWPVKAVPNIFDWTGMYSSLIVKATPTTVFLNRKTGTLRRIDEACDEGTLRRMFMEVAEQPGDEWPPRPNTDLPPNSNGLRLDRLGQGAFRATTPEYPSVTDGTPIAMARETPLGEGAQQASAVQPQADSSVRPDPGAVTPQDPGVGPGGMLTTPGSASAGPSGSKDFSDAFLD